MSENENVESNGEVSQPAPLTFEPAKTRRGRPPKIPNAEPANVADGVAPKKRGRPPKNRAPINNPNMAKQLVGLHLIAASALGIPELQISESEAESLAQGINAVCEEYGLSLSGKTGAALQLFAACAMIYAPRALAVKSRIAKEQKEKVIEHGDVAIN